MQYFRGNYKAGGTIIVCALDDGAPYYPLSVCLEAYGIKPPDNQILIPKKSLPASLYKEVLQDIVLREISELTYGSITGMLVELKPNWREVTKVNK